METIIKIDDSNFNYDIIEMHNPTFRFGARGIVRKSDGKIALLKKAKKNQYKLPGGGIEFGENPYIAFTREVIEETGCEIKVIDEVGIVEEYKSLINFKQVSYIFVSEVINDTKNRHLTDEECNDGLELLWKEPSEALELMLKCIDKNLISKLTDEEIYQKQFIVYRDIKILEYYINKYLNKKSKNK